MSIKSNDPSADIQKARPKLKANTVKQYEIQLKRLQKLFDTEGWDFLNNIDSVKDKLSDKHFTTSRNYYNSIIVLLMALNHDEAHDDLIKKYVTVRDSLNEKYAEEQSSGKISEKQSKNFVELNEIQKMIKTMENEIKKEKIKKKEKLTKNDIELLNGYTIFSFLIRLPTRNDVAGMQLIGKTQYNKLSDKDKEDTNYLVREKSKMFVVLNEYKTKSKYGEKKIDVPKDLEKILRMYLKLTKKNNGDIIFANFKGESISRNGISQLLIKTSKHYLDKSISTTMMRKIILSDKFSEVNGEKQEMAHITGHDVSVMDSVYVKQKD
jgi:hypothetical protein